MTQATQLYALSIAQCAELIATVATETTVLVQGDIGAGKSSILHMLADRLPGHTACYFDCTTKDLGDITLPRIADTAADGASLPFVSYATNEELGAHINKPIILMIDEYGKANPAVKNALLRLMQERQIGSYKLHPDSLIFATTNLGAEGVGDMLPPHARNRIMVVRMAKPSSTHWIEWGINNGMDPSVLGWVRENPQLMQSFDEVQNPDDNPYIYHPRAQRAAFVTPRSLHKASNLLKRRGGLDDHTITAGLIGTLGERGAMDLMAFVRLANDLPSLESIKRDPLNAKVPNGAAATCMIVYRTLAIIERDWVQAWMDYLNRLPAEAAGLFVNGVRVKGYGKQGMMMTHAAFTTFARANSHLFAADV
jgi:hypothetical protein